MRSTHGLLVFVLALAIAGCGESVSKPDAGEPPVDAGGQPDASVAPDAGEEPDAGDPADAGESPDGGGCSGPDADKDGVCDAEDPCPASASNDSDNNTVCDDVDLCSALAQLKILPATRQPGDELAALPGSFPSVILNQATLSYVWTLDGQSTLYSTAVIPANVTKAEEVWEVTATATFDSRASC